MWSANAVGIVWNFYEYFLWAHAWSLLAATFGVTVTLVVLGRALISRRRSAEVV